ncbi:MAG: hypothetical protein LIP01_15625 [Tannerellaceae bacterium]|nr:hypothetical protein [Tannerellaceae bacterium]
MKKKKITYEELTEKLKNSYPVLDNPEKLTDAIMRQIEKQPVHTPTFSLLKLTGYISGVASCILIAFLAYEVGMVSSYPSESIIQTKSVVYKNYPEWENMSPLEILSDYMRKTTPRIAKEKLFENYLTNNEL